MIDLPVRFASSRFEVICKVPEWAKTFEVTPEDIERQIAFGVGWIINNPRKAPKNIIRFLYNWMLLANRKGSFRKTPAVLPAPPKENEQDVMSGDDFTRMKEAVFGKK